MTWFYLFEKNNGKTIILCTLLKSSRFNFAPDKQKISDDGANEISKILNPLINEIKQAFPELAGLL